MYDPSLGRPPTEQSGPRPTRSQRDAATGDPGSRPDLETDPYAHTTIAPSTPSNQWDAVELRRLRDTPYHPLQEMAERELQSRRERRLPGWDEKRDALDDVLDEPIDHPDVWADERALLEREPVGQPESAVDATDLSSNAESLEPAGDSVGVESLPEDLDLERFVAMTVYPLTHFDRLDYISKCKHCESRPYSEGPHHDRSCPRYDHQLRYDTHHATRKYCKHEDCKARPFVAGFHHHPDCPRGFDARTDWQVADDGYNTPCVCGAKPYSEGPHHRSDCEYHTATPRFRTDRAHSATCGTCGAKPFPPGPHHEQNCEHHVDAVPVPLALRDD
ncbi:hypothetical protein EFA46_013355 (plasmid) [Halarchaeum sp. CBA1220]|uniref:hypothetical protein n=1 Tax=Halarchaeum sp. CBA1220 TaxID=1853682 RepID=UPI0011CD38A5|nr:hypothetical protein [Halarchaeum sp. CBA1220]QLC35251.1 hypothetical protein EFA46_013355 [Halarchaeum sp. CBA1220]